MHGTDGTNPDVPDAFDRATLGIRQIGDITIIGGREHGTGFAMTPGHIILCANMNVLEDAVRTAASGKRRFSPSAMDGAIHVGFQPLLCELYEEVRRERRTQRSPAGERLIQLLQGFVSISADVKLEEGISGQIDFAMARNDMTQMLLDAPADENKALGFIPDNALLAVGGGIAPTVFRTIADITVFEEEDLTAPVRLMQLASAGDGAFALMPGSFHQ